MKTSPPNGGPSCLPNQKGKSLSSNNNIGPYPFDPSGPGGQMGMYAHSQFGPYARHPSVVPPIPSGPFDSHPHTRGPMGMGPMMGGRNDKPHSFHSTGGKLGRTQSVILCVSNDRGEVTVL